MSGNGSDHTSIINSTLTELAFLLIYGFMLTGAVASVIPPKEPGIPVEEPGPPKPPTVELRACGRGTILDGNTCVPDTTHKENHCYLLNGRD
jgi:hypothetical protein